MDSIHLPKSLLSLMIYPSYITLENTLHNWKIKLCKIEKYDFDR